MAWVHKNLEKRPVLSVPNALETLENRVGDCNEHAVLLAAFARAAGIPAEVEAGVVYLRGRFFYHAWNVLYLRDRGGWVTADAVLGQMPADVTHIRFVRGGADRQLDLVGLIGRLKLEILEMTTMIELTNLTKRYGDTLAVDHLNLSVAKGEIFGFIGPNGAGKTTTIRMMAGVLGPTEGTVLIDGIPMAADPEAAKRIIGFIPDRPFLYEKLTGMEFMRFIADLYGFGDGIFREKAEGLLIQFSLYDWADHLIEAYSHGMKQRLVIASALLHDPRVIIVDEPMVGLDPAGIRMVKDLLRELARQGDDDLHVHPYPGDRRRPL